MPGKTPREAVEAFIDPLKDTLSCVAHAKIILSPGGWGETGKIHGLTVNDDQPVKLQRRGRRGPILMLRVQMLYEIIRTKEQDRPPWRVPRAPTPTNSKL